MIKSPKISTKTYNFTVGEQTLKNICRIYICQASNTLYLTFLGIGGKKGNKIQSACPVLEFTS